MKTFSFVFFFIALFSSNLKAEKMTSVPIASYEEVKDLPNHPEKLLIDVREPSEVAETGSIPTAINIPCKFNVQQQFHNKFEWTFEIKTIWAK